MEQNSQHLPGKEKFIINYNNVRYILLKEASVCIYFQGTDFIQFGLTDAEGQMKVSEKELETFKKVCENIYRESLVIEIGK